MIRLAAKPLPCILLVILPLLSGCRSESSDSKEPSEIVDVPPALEIPIENDEVAAPRTVELSGVMPANFPSDLPLHKPSSLVNFGDDEGRAWVELLSADPRIHVERTLLDAVRRAGWSAEPVAGGIELRRGGRSVTLVIRDGDPGTVYRYLY